MTTTPPTGGGAPPDPGGQGEPSGPPAPPPPPAQPPSAQQPTASTSRLQQSLDQAQAAARNPGGGGTPSGSKQTTPRPSGGDQEDNNPHHGRNNGMKAGTAILIVGILALIVFFGLGWKSCSTVDKLVERTAPGTVVGSAPGSAQPGGTDSGNPGAPPGSTSGTNNGRPTTSNQVPPGTPSPTITGGEANNTRECNSTIVGKGSGRWYMVGTPTDSQFTLAARFCVGKDGTFRAAESARIVGRMAYIREGGHEASGNVDTKYKLSDLAPGKAYADISQTVNGTEKSWRLENPYMVFVDEGNAFDFCEQYKMKSRPAKDDLVAQEIWARCMAGGQQNTAVAQSIAQNPSWFSREDGASLSAKVQALEQKVAANGGQPVKMPPKEVDFNAAGPSK